MNFQKALLGKHRTIRGGVWGLHRVKWPGRWARGWPMQRQGSFSPAEYAGKKKQTRRDKFLAEVELVAPWARLVERLRPLYPKGERGRPPIGLERMLPIFVVQQWYGLADEALEDASTVPARGMFGDAQAKDAGLDQPADIAERTAAFQPTGGAAGGVKPGDCRAVRPLDPAVPVDGCRPSCL
jgi:transposase, IS5 family